MMRAGDADKVGDPCHINLPSGTLPFRSLSLVDSRVGCRVDNRAIAIPFDFFIALRVTHIETIHVMELKAAQMMTLDEAFQRTTELAMAPNHKDATWLHRFGVSEHRMCQVSFTAHGLRKRNRPIDVKGGVSEVYEGIVLLLLR